MRPRPASATTLSMLMLHWAPRWGKLLYLGAPPKVSSKLFALAQPMAKWQRRSGTGRRSLSCCLEVQRCPEGSGSAVPMLGLFALCQIGLLQRLRGCGSPLSWSSVTPHCQVCSFALC